MVKARGRRTWREQRLMEPHKKIDYGTALVHARSAFFACSSDLIKKGFKIQLASDIPDKVPLKKGEVQWSPALPWISKADVSKIAWIPVPKEGESPPSAKRLKLKKATPEEVRRARRNMEEAESKMQAKKKKKGTNITKQLKEEFAKAYDCDSDIDVEEDSDAAATPVSTATTTSTATITTSTAATIRDSLRRRPATGQIRIGSQYQAVVPEWDEGEETEDDNELDPSGGDDDVEESFMPCKIIAHREVRKQLQWKVEYDPTWLYENEKKNWKDSIAKILHERTDVKGRQEFMVQWKLDWEVSACLPVKAIVEYAGDMVLRTHF